MKKRILSMLIVMLFIFNAQCVLANDEIIVLVDGEQVEFDVAPIAENGRILVPARAIFEKLGADVEWDQETQGVYAEKKGISVALWLDNAEFLKNMLLYSLDVPVKVVNNRTLVPLRAVAEAFDCKVMWDEASKTVSITSPKELVSYEMVEETVVEKTDNEDINITVTYVYPRITDGKEFLTEREVERVNQISKKMAYDFYDYDEYAYSFYQEWGGFYKEDIDGYTKPDVRISLTASEKYGTVSLMASTVHPWNGLTASAITLTKDYMGPNELFFALNKSSLDVGTVYQEMFAEFADRYEYARYFDEEAVNYIISDDKLTFFMSSIDITGVGRVNRYYAVSKEY